MAKKTTTDNTAVEEAVDTVIAAAPVVQPLDFGEYEFFSDITQGHIAETLDSLFPGEWRFEVQSANYPVTHVAVSGVITIRGRQFPGVGAAPVVRGKLGEAAREAKRLALLDALDFAGANVEFPEEPGLDRSPASNGYSRSNGSAGGSRGSYSGGGSGRSNSGGYRSGGGASRSQSDNPEEGLGEYYCADCEDEGAEDSTIRPYQKQSGGTLSPKQIAEWAQQEASRPLCWDHLKVVLDQKQGRGGRGGGRSGGYSRGGGRGGYRR